MELYILDTNFKEVGAISAFDTLIWNRKYYAPGEFEIYLDRKYWDILKYGRYICRQENTDTGILEHIGMDDENRRIFATGRTMEAVLADAVVDTQTDFTGISEEIIRKMIQGFAMPKNSKLSLGDVHNIGVKTTLQCTGDNVMEKAFETAKEAEATVCVIYDYLTDTLKAEVRKGLDRSEGQTEHTLAVFSTEDGSAENPKYDLDITDYKNFAYVAGEDAGKNRIVVTIDLRENTDEAKREVWIDARDLQSEEMSAEAYKEALRQRGLEKLTEYQKIETVEITAGNNKHLVYREDFDVGDICSCIDEASGIAITARITEAVETIEGNVKTLDITFGDEKKDLTHRIAKGVV